MLFLSQASHLDLFPSKSERIDALTLQKMCSSLAFFPAAPAIRPTARVHSPNGPSFFFAQLPPRAVSKAKKGPPTTHPTRPQPTKTAVSEGFSFVDTVESGAGDGTASTIGGSEGTGSKVKSLSATMFVLPICLLTIVDLLVDLLG